MLHISLMIAIVGILIICHLRSVQAPCSEPYVSHGTITKTDGNLLHSKAYVSCDEHYTWKGSELSFCIDTGEWFPPLGKCYGKCKKPFIRHSANITGPDIVEHNGIIQMFCRAGWSIPHQGFLRCVDGQFEWRDKDHAGPWDKIECQGSLGCPSPPQPKHGTVETDMGNAVSSIATIRCDEGYTYGGWIDKSMCGIDGIWRPHIRHCLANCRSPPEVRNSIHTRQWSEVEHGHPYQVHCKSGFAVNNGGMVICDDGKWKWLLAHADDHSQQEEVTCKPMCKVHEIPFSSRISTSTRLVHDAVVEVICEAGYTIKNDGILRCHHGEWRWNDASVAQTEKIRCFKMTEGDSRMEDGLSLSVKDQDNSSAALMSTLTGLIVSLMISNVNNLV